jgi:hypothetical protein
MFGIIVDKKNSLIRAAFGFNVLLLGAAEYIFSRPPESSHIGILIKRIAGNIPKINLFGILGGVMPDFAHACAFSLFTLVLFPRAVRKMRILICLFWLAIDVFFETGQYFGQQISGLINTILPPNTVAALLKGYFVNGKYDPMDILAMVLGVGTAFLIGELTTKQGGLKK